MEWQRRSLRRCYRQLLTSHHVLSDVRDRGGGCSSKETKAEMLAALQEREAARELLRTDPANSNLRRTLKAAGTRLKCVRFEVVQRFFEEFVSQLEVRIRDGDQAGFYKHLKGMISRAGDRAASYICLLYTSPSPRDQRGSRMPSSA